MDGIEIISKVEILAAESWVYPMFVVFVVLAIIFAILSQKKETIIRDMFTLFFAGIAIILLIDGPTRFAEPTGRYEYTAYIDESVNVSEFFETYENVTFDGKVYKFEDKKIE